MSNGGKGKHRTGSGEYSEQPDTWVDGHAASYVLKFIKCGKPNCKVCKNGNGHGPYKYLTYRTDEGKIITKYKGKF
jgi:hypothetical protein